MTGVIRQEPAQARGRRRKDALLDAAVDLLERGGSAQVTHRAVADRAALPLAATTYYFRSREDLLTQAFTRLVARGVAAVRERLRPVAGAGPAAVADVVVGALAPFDEAERSRHLALCELYFQVGREPAFRPLARTWSTVRHEAVTEVLRQGGYPHSPADVDILVAAVEGMIAQDLVEARPGTIKTMVDTVTRLLRALRATAPSGSPARPPEPTARPSESTARPPESTARPSESTARPPEPAARPWEPAARPAARPSQSTARRPESTAEVDRTASRPVPAARRPYDETDAPSAL
ncbi:TetR family transcriptional regulator [Actinoallomurus sp. NPDC052274]|uniref:TetR/AcrR family transcriptional regulator n=1 Tax=Actinoallomurus sp. NPDC052274 TaxID=3155420 RepID=UPI00341AE503